MMNQVSTVLGLLCSEYFDACCCLRRRGPRRVLRLGWVIVGGLGLAMIANAVPHSRRLSQMLARFATPSGRGRAPRLDANCARPEKASRRNAAKQELYAGGVRMLLPHDLTRTRPPLRQPCFEGGSKPGCAADPVASLSAGKLWTLPASCPDSLAWAGLDIGRIDLRIYQRSFDVFRFAARFFQVQMMAAPMPHAISE